MASKYHGTCAKASKMTGGGKKMAKMMAKMEKREKGEKGEKY